MRTEILGVSREEIERAKEYILEGGVVAFHTETVYGLGANAFNDDAVQKIFALKGRPADNPLIAHVHRDYDISSLVDFVPDYAILLRKAFLPGPLTMVYPSTGKVSKYVSCGLNTLAIRVPSSVTAQKRSICRLRRRVQTAVNTFHPLRQCMFMTISRTRFP